eukprot:1107672-Rhodomonas_salina.1
MLCTRSLLRKSLSAGGSRYLVMRRKRGGGGERKEGAGRLSEVTCAVTRGCEFWGGATCLLRGCAR